MRLQSGCHPELGEAGEDLTSADGVTAVERDSPHRMRLNRSSHLPQPRYAFS